MRLIAPLVVILFWIAAPASARITAQHWGKLDGEKVFLYTLTNANGVTAQITNYGAILTALMAPDRHSHFASVVNGFDSLADYTSRDYLKHGAHYGAVLGRYANRIKMEAYTIDGVTYHRTKVGKPFDERVWRAQMQDGASPRLVLSLTDPAGTMGFPGTVKASVTYTLTDDNCLRLDYRATTDAPTIVNMTNHSYFNLAAHGSVLVQLLTINADAITPGDKQNVPTGEVRPVGGTAFDFRTPTLIGAHINDPDPLLQQQQGYGVNYQLNGKPGMLRFAARLEDPKSGRVMEEWTTQPDMQLYTANYQPPRAALAKGYGLRTGVALEAEHAPNSPNDASFLSPRVTPGKPLHEITEFRLSVDRSPPEARR